MKHCVTFYAAAQKADNHMSTNENAKPDSERDDIRVEIATPRGMYVGAFSKNTKIAEVIAVVVKEKKLDGGDSYELVFDGKVLQPTERPLVSFHLPNPAKLNLVAIGTGV